MRVCLIDAAAVGSKRLLPQWTPLGLAYIAAVLERHGHSVRIIERDVLLRRNRLSLKRVDRLTYQALRAYEPDIVGIGSPTELFFDAVRAARIAKEAAPNRPVVYGGHHATALPVEVLEACPQIDLVAVGEGEQTMAELAEGRLPSEVAGLYFRDGSRIAATAARRPLTDLDALPPPALHLLDMEFYTRSTFTLIRNLTLRSVSVLSSRGCPFRCAFCVESLPAGRIHRFHSAARVVSELEHLSRTYRIDAVYFLDEGFLGNPQRVVELCDLMIREGLPKRLKWCAQVRADSVDTDILQRMRSAGCVQVECGFETTADHLLQRTAKGIRAAGHLEIIRRIQAAGIRCAANIIVGLPGETAVDFERTIRFISTSGVDAVNFARFAPYPGSIFYRQLRADGQLQKGFWMGSHRCYADFNFTRMSNSDFRFAYSRAIKTVISPLNTRDRMLHTSPWQRIKHLSFQELFTAICKAPELIPAFFINWIAARFGRRKPAGVAEATSRRSKER